MTEYRGWGFMNTVSHVGFAFGYGDEVILRPRSHGPHAASPSAQPFFMNQKKAGRNMAFEDVFDTGTMSPLFAKNRGCSKGDWYLAAFALRKRPGEKSTTLGTFRPLFDRRNQWNILSEDRSTGIIILDGASTARIVFRGIFCPGVTAASKKKRNTPRGPNGSRA
ncbi:hypothetical protein JB92DRAFT_2827054 [Gautieria morchelliformis]|nr:hypothetical protein JB92DRAFT_2827054 [Gautieria morchelliformis]